MTSKNRISKVDGPYGIPRIGIRIGLMSMFFSLIFQDLPMEAAEAIVAKSKDKTSPEKTLGVNH